MLFHSPTFAVFFAVLFVAYALVASTRRTRLAVLTIGSLVFYASWGWRFLPVLAATGFTDYQLAKAIHRSDSRQRRRFLLVSSVVLNVGVLACFKYVRFALESIVLAAGLFDVHVPIAIPAVVAPLGVSFYTLQSLSYVIDVYRGTFEPKASFFEFFSSLVFFPHLLAGPIVRSAFFLPQFRRPSLGTWPAVRHGFVLLGVGFAKKAVADRLAGQADALFAATGPVSALAAWTGVLAFAGQIYADFSGYTDIARGLSRLLGYELPPNFALPYFATSPREFWRRWHISLSTWLRDYLYIPLGGNRRWRWRNVVVTMLIGGLWHGPSWTFVVWGAYHGALLVAQMGTERWLWRGDGGGRRNGEQDGDRDGPRPRLFPPRTRKLASIGVTFYFVVLGWVPFRARTLHDAARILCAMHAPTVPSHFTYGNVLAFVLTLSGIVSCHLLDQAVLGWSRVPERRPWLAWATASVGFSFPMILGEPGRAFVYFAF